MQPIHDRMKATNNDQHTFPTVLPLELQRREKSPSSLPVQYQKHSLSHCCVSEIRTQAQIREQKKKNPWHSSHTIPPTEYPPRESRDQSIKSHGKPWITHLIDPQSILPHITVKSSEYFKAFMNIFLIDTLTTRLGAPVWLSSYEAALQNSLLPLTSSPPPRRQTLQMDQLSLRQMRYIKQMSVLTKVPTENLGLSGAQAAHWARGCCNNWADS